MSNPNDFVIENGVLIKYKGTDPVVTVPDGVTSIGGGAFSYCSSLNSVTLPEGLTSIGSSAFSGCSSLTSVTLPEGLTCIGNEAFQWCKSLTSVTLPESLTSIGDSAFWGCSSLTRVTLPEGLTSIGDGAFWGCSSLTSVTLPEGLTSIGDAAFCECSSLTSVTLPESLTNIGDSAFWGCSSLNSVTLPESLTSIGDWAFKGCSSLIKIVFPASLKKNGKEAFAGCENLVSVSGGGAIAFAKNSFGTDDWPYNSCKKLKYTSEMFKNAGQLPDLFAGHLSVCDAEALAWVYIYQKGEVWEKALAKVLTAENAPAILAAMAAFIREAKYPKKAATAAAAFVRANVLLLSGEGIAELLDALRSKKQTTLADELAVDPAVATALHSEEKPAAETDEQVLPDGTILYGKVKAPLAVGSRFAFGTSGGCWRILQMNEEEHTVLVVSEEIVCERVFHNKWEKVTWETSDVRAWLNGEYLNTAFSEEERAAIIESEIENPDNPKYHTKGGNPTKDKIFLLSIDEATRYFNTDADRATGTWWWLRSPGYGEDKAARVSNVGSLHVYGYDVNIEGGIRPAFKINPESGIFKSLLSENRNGEPVIVSPMLRIKAGEVIWANPDAVEVVLPSYVKKIAAGAFRNSMELKTVTWQGAVPVIDKEAFFNCPNLRLPAEVYTGKKLPDENLAPYIPDDPAIISAAMLQKKDGEFRRAAIARLTSENAAAVADALLLRAADWTDAEFMLRFAFAAAPLPGEKLLKAFSAALTKAKLTNRGWKTFLLREGQSAARELAPVFFDVPFAILQTKTEALSGLPALREILPAVYPYAEAYDFGYVDSSDFRKGAKEYAKNAEAETAAKKLDHKALMGLLLSWTATDGPRWYAPYAAYANEEELAELIAEMKAWEKDKTKKEQLIRVRGAILLGDTVTAMRYADSLGLLERYAALRGLDADTLRDETISDFGLDLSGRRIWTLAGKTLTAALNNDLTFTLTDESGKALKSVPKKGADEAEYETVKKEFAALKKDVKSTAKTRNDKIFADFLSGRARPAEAWKNGYLDNAVLIALARLIVWAQGENTFTLKETGELITVDGAAYTLTDEPVKVAHPMEMTKEDVEAWQHYFTSNALRQPFEQVWEPVADSSLVKPGRYDGCTVPLYALMNKEKHGIVMEGRSQITLKDCSADLIYIEGHHDWVNNEFEVKNFTFKTYTRQVNHIVVHLDKATVAGRIKKDDVSASQWFDRFTLAQIQSFIDLANDNKATNVLALLLEYKEKTFPDFDPMAEFTLEW